MSKSELLITAATHAVMTAQCCINGRLMGILVSHKRDGCFCMQGGSSSAVRSNNSLENSEDAVPSMDTLYWHSMLQFGCRSPPHSYSTVVSTSYWMEEWIYGNLLTLWKAGKSCFVDSPAWLKWSDNKGCLSSSVALSLSLWGCDLLLSNAR